MFMLTRLFNRLLRKSQILKHILQTNILFQLLPSSYKSSAMAESKILNNLIVLWRNILNWREQNSTKEDNYHKGTVSRRKIITKDCHLVLDLNIFALI